MPTASFARLVGSAVQRAGLLKQSTWHTPFMSAATLAVMERVGMVDFVVEVRDARVSTYCVLGGFAVCFRFVLM